MEKRYIITGNADSKTKTLKDIEYIEGEKLFKESEIKDLKIPKYLG